MNANEHAPIGEDEHNCPCIVGMVRHENFDHSFGWLDCGCNCHYPVGPFIRLDGRGEPYVY